VSSLMTRTGSELARSARTYCHHDKKTLMREGCYMN
jgi:hypothetical protein